VFLTITATGTAERPATDLGFLLHKHPGRAQSFSTAHGTAHVFYPEAEPERCTAALLLEVDPVALVRRGRGRSGGQSPDSALGQYVNDRPYAASSLLSVALSTVFKSALKGQCAALPERAAMPLPLRIEVPVLPARGGEELVRRLFAPIGWTSVSAEPLPLDEEFPEWGPSRYVRLELTGELTLADALSQLYVLLPVLDGAKHYWVAPDEIDKLIRAGRGWLADHPERELIVSRYLARRRGLARQAAERLELARLAEVDDLAAEDLDNAVPDSGELSGDEPGEEFADTAGGHFGERRANGRPEREDGEPSAADGLAPSGLAPSGLAPSGLAPSGDGRSVPVDTSAGTPDSPVSPDSSVSPDAPVSAVPGAAPTITDGAGSSGTDGAGGKPVPLAVHRQEAVLAVLRAAGAARVLDLGCGEGRLVQALLKDVRFTEIVGVDVSVRALTVAARRLRLERMGERQAARVRLVQGSLTYTDKRLAGYDAAVLSEVIEHLDLPRLPALEYAVFRVARPVTVIVTTPNAEYNVRWDSLPAGTVRHADHRFEWDRARFRAWARETAERGGYRVEFAPVGPDDPEVGPPTQMAVFTRADSVPAGDSGTGPAPGYGAAHPAPATGTGGSGTGPGGARIPADGSVPEARPVPEGSSGPGEPSPAHPAEPRTTTGKEAEATP
jgi:SAM-dependent methyltransferase